MYFSSRYLQYETTAKSGNFDYGEIVKVITDKMVNVNMGGSGYVLEAVAVETDYAPRIGDWVTIEWRNGNPIARGGGNISTGLRNINNSVKIVSTSDMASGVVNSDHIRTNSIDARHISAYSIQASHISANSINASHISANAITSQSIESNSILARHIRATEINSTHIATDSINSVHITANAIRTNHISANSIVSSHISANSIQTGHISSNTITTSHIMADSITTNLISSNAISTRHISSNTIDGNHIKANSISGNHISASIIQATHISANSIQTSHISANSINTGHIQANAINTNNINADAVQARNISANAIQSRHISANSIQSNHISANTIQTSHLTANLIQATHISANSITTSHISANTITGQMVKSNEISGNHIAAGSIDTDKLTVGTRKEGLLGQYYTYNPASGNSKFQVFKGHQIDPTINFSWGTGSPSIVGQIDTFAVRWQGFVFAPEAGNYQFHVKADDGMRVVINNTEVVNQTAYAGMVEQTGTIALEKDKWYPILVEMFEGAGGASAELRWTTPSLVKEIIPSKYFTQGNTVIDGATITTGSITTSHIKTGTITASSGIIADLAVQTAHIANAAITSAKIGNAEIKEANIASGNIINAHIKDATITSAKIQSVNADTISAGTLNAQRIGAATIEGYHISGNTIQGNHIKANSIDSLHIKAGAITATEISAGSISSEKIQAGSITGDVIRAGSISAYHISTAGLDAQQITVYNGNTGETLIGSGFLRVDGLDVGVVRSDNLLANGLFLTASSSFGYKRDNIQGEAIAGARSQGNGGHKVWKIDLATGQKVAEIDITGKKPMDIAVHPSGNHAYVTVQGDNTVVQIDLTNDIAGKVLKSGSGMGPGVIKWTGTYLEDHKHFFVLNSDPHDHHVPDSLIVIDAPPNSVNSDLYLHHEIALGNGPFDLVVDNNKQCYITMANDGDIVVLDMQDHDSSKWKIRGRIPIAAYGTDNYHGGLPSQFGFNEVTGGNSAAQYDSSSGAHASHGAHSHGGYGTPSGDLKVYEPRGIAQSSDQDTLYVVDKKNNELVVVDKFGKAPYNALTGTTSTSPVSITDGHAGHGGMTMTSGNATGEGSSPEDLINAGEVHGGGPGTYYVRYRIPVGDSPEFVEVVNGKIYVTLEGSSQVAVISESNIINEINLDRAFYTPAWTPFDAMRAIGTINVSLIDVGTKPTFMSRRGNDLLVTLSAQNKIAVIDTTTNTVSQEITTGANPRGSAVTPDGRFLYVVNHGGVGNLSFIYPDGPYIGDAFFGLEGGIVYQGAEYWTPDRSNWTYDASGNVKSYSTVEFRVNEPFLNEGGYAKLSAFGKDYQYAQIEQDIYNVTNFSNGNNTAFFQKQRLVSNSGNTIFYCPQGEWISSPAPSNIKILSMVSGNILERVAPSNKYTIYYGKNSRVEFSGGTVMVDEWVIADYKSKFNKYFEPHNGSIQVAVENGSSTNFYSTFEIDEFVPKFVVYDNLQTSDFTPTQDGINETYTGIEYSVATDRASNRTTITSSAGNIATLKNITDGDMMTEAVLPSGLQYVTIDLGKKYMIGKVQVVHKHTMVDMGGKDRKYKNTKTQVSEDGTNWTTIYDSAVSGMYLENEYHPMHDHRHEGKTITFPARPIRYVRDYANGWISEDGLTSGTDNTWAEIKVFGDWEFEEGYRFPANSEKAGQQIATNGKGFVATDISNAYVAIDIQTEFTTWWYMTYITGPEFGEIAVEMPTAMGGSHFLDQGGMFLNNVAHRHIMPFTPSYNIKGNSALLIKPGKHRAVLRQSSGRVSIDRFRFEDFQYYRRNSLSIPSTSSATTFRRYKTVAEQARWYEGVGTQTTDGAYDKPRLNVDTGLPDKSVPIKYRIRFRVELNANGTVEERGTTYITSAIFETGKQHTHWRPSASSDSYPASKIEFWDGNQPHKTGIQNHHLANGSVRGAKIMTGAIMDYHVSNYARISEHKLDLQHPTHAHGRHKMIVGAGPFGTDLHVFEDNKDVLDSIERWSGISGNYGTGNTIARGDHNHDDRYLQLAGGTVDGNITFNSLVTLKGQANPSTLKADAALSLEHASGGSSSIFFKSGSNHPSDFGYIRFEDSRTGSGETNQLTIGVENDGTGNTDRLQLKAFTLINADNISTDPSSIVEFQHNSVYKGKIDAGGNLDLVGNITLSGNVDGVDISTFKSAYDTHAHSFASLTGKPTTISGYGITDSITTAGGQTINGSLNINQLFVDGIKLIDLPLVSPEVGSLHNPIFYALRQGKMLYKDEEFAIGFNTVATYNNSGGDGVAISRIDMPTAPNLSKKVIEIRNNGNPTSPGLGGFHQAINSKANAVFVQMFKAKIPVGYSLNSAANSLGSGSLDYWMTNTAGTGKWETYIRVTVCGNTGTFSSGGHVYLSGSPAPTSVAPLSWYIASSTVFELTDLTAQYLGINDNAVSATKLQTARTISLGGSLTGSASFDGTGNITISGGVADNSHLHTVANITGLQTTLTGLQTSIDGKAPLSHNHLWAHITDKPSTFTPSSHTHSTADITDLSTSYYNKSEVNTLVANAGDIRAGNANVFTKTNTFANAGLGIKIQPSGGVIDSTKMLQVNKADSTEVFSVNYSGGVTIRGDLNVIGVQTYSGTTTVDGDYTINGQLIAKGNNTLGDSSTDLTTVNGTLKVQNGTIQEVGKYVEVHRRPIYGLAGDLQFQTDSVVFEDIVTNVYSINGSALPAVQAGATRYYRLYIVYSDDITGTQQSAGQKATLRIAGPTNKDIDLPNVWGEVNARKDWFSGYFTDLPAGHANFQAKLAQAGNNLGIRWIELVAYDKF